ncbi:vanadium-dependent haloperoxidase [Mucilaginibacter pallidiroseus]|uniref:Vanadium-dependent haloperoxidase n=2 Tax=Mucilaginibacter pallidiroseus TaxID=2599295 RepID=A0A563UKD6_9SPHI|nr:vanadium-dependent haloperoxidase [Mucilaginibacter pallidiroseus]
MKFKYFSMLLLCTSQIAVAQKAPAPAYPDYLEPDHAVNAVTMVMVHDVVGPPVAGRYYAYAMLGAYNIVAANNKNVPALNTLVASYKPVKFNVADIKYDYKIAAYYSILETSKQLLPSGYMLKDDEDAFVQLLEKTGVEKNLIKNSVKVAEEASTAIVVLSKTDHYSQISALKRYTPSKEDGKWYPTPPAYMEALEPNWKTVRTMIIDSAQQYKPKPLTKFSKDSTSAFYSLVKDVYNASKHLTPEQTDMALFWDCNPFAVTTSGHMAIGYKKISPGGHWMHVAGLVTKQANLGFDESVVVLTLEGATIMDAFISCWEEKFASNRIRPETFINRYMDIKWQPVLQTPPFPEYTSGHAVISNASAELLTYLLGDNFAYTDNTEIPFGSSQRDFKSFRQAAAEASMSRFYGGIHYMDSIEQGNEQGKSVANGILAKVKKAGIRPFIK